MLSELIDQYVRRCEAASRDRRFEYVIQILDEMRAELRSNPPPTEEVLEHMENVLRSGAKGRAQFVFVAAWSNLSPKYCLTLCRILESESCSDIYEQAIELLAEVGDASAVPSLKKAVSYRCDYDEWLLVPRKALQALWAIGTEDARDAVRAALTSTEPEIREEAESLLRPVPK